MAATTTALSESVRRGYDALIAAGHTAEAIREAVLAPGLDMGSCSRCVIGRLYCLDAHTWVPLNSFERAIGEVIGDPDEAWSQWGFNAAEDEDDPAGLESLAAEWRRLVTEMADASS